MVLKKVRGPRAVYNILGAGRRVAELHRERKTRDTAEMLKNARARMQAYAAAELYFGIAESYA